MYIPCTSCIYLYLDGDRLSRVQHCRVHLTYGGSGQRLGVKVRQFLPPSFPQLLLHHPLSRQREAERERERDRERGRERDRQREAEREAERERERDRERGRERDRQREAERERQRQRETER